MNSWLMNSWSMKWEQGNYFVEMKSDDLDFIRYDVSDQLRNEIAGK